jgi:hypothetical protein
MGDFMEGQDVGDFLKFLIDKGGVLPPLSIVADGALYPRCELYRNMWKVIEKDGEAIKIMVMASPIYGGGPYNFLWVKEGEEIGKPEDYGLLGYSLLVPIIGMKIGGFN